MVASVTQVGRECVSPFLPPCLVLPFALPRPFAETVVVAAPTPVVGELKSSAEVGAKKPYLISNVSPRGGHCPE